MSNIFNKIKSSLLFRLYNSWFYYKYLYLKKVKKQKRSNSFKPESLAIMSVFILKENILFLEEWIQHHIGMGVDYFVLYDNSQTQKKDGETRYTNVVPGKVNKHNFNYDELISAEDANQLLKKILNEYRGKIEIVTWAKKDETGIIRFFQLEAFKHFCENYYKRFDFGLFIDMDEFMISRSSKNLKDIVKEMNTNKITSMYFNSKLFSSRFNHIGTPIKSINFCLKEDRLNQGQKTLLKLSANTKIDNLHNLKSLGVQSICNNDKMIFYHYCYVYNGPGTHLIEDKIATSYFKKLPNIE